MTQNPPPATPPGFRSPAGTPASGSAPGWPAPPPSKALAVTALVLGLCALVWGPWIIPGLGILLGLAGIVLGIVSLATHRKGHGMAIGGIIAGVLVVLQN